MSTPITFGDALHALIASIYELLRAYSRPAFGWLSLAAGYILALWVFDQAFQFPAAWGISEDEMWWWKLGCLFVFIALPAILAIALSRRAPASVATENEEDAQ